MLKRVLVALFAVYSLQFTVVGVYASETLDDAWSYFLEGDYRKSIKKCEKLGGPRAHYIMGLSYLKLGRPLQARKHLIFILDTYSHADMTEEATLSIADSYFLDADYDNAAIKYTDFLNKFPASGLSSLAYLKLGQSQRRLGYWAEARASLSKVIRDFPYSLEKEEAQKELSKEFYYYVQVAAFTRITNANRTHEALRRRGFDAYINKIMRDKKTFYRICVGKFYNKQDAAVVLKRLKSDGYKARIYP